MNRVSIFQKAAQEPSAASRALGFVGLALLLGTALIGGWPSRIPAVAASPEMTRARVREQVKQLQALGARLFSDPSLSASGALACSSCHDPANGFGPPDAAPVRLGGGDLRVPGFRAVPSLKYLQHVPAFTEHFFDSEDDGDESVDAGPTGGLTWDGRVDRGADQARIPLLSPFEMGNANPAEVASKAVEGGYGNDLAAIYGPGILEDQRAVFDAVVKALEVYEQDYRTFYPYTSRYDAYLAGRIALSERERHGLDLFNDPRKGNCASCHISQRGNDGTPPQFTDYGLIAIGVPRNPGIPANADPKYHDLGLCGPLRTDFKDRDEYCGLFRTPTLRNVAQRKVFFHNGIFHSLKDVVSFYATRDTDPGRWYPRRPDGSIDKFDDLPARYHANLNTNPPFDRKVHDAPVLTEAEIDDVVAFLETLTDGFLPLDEPRTAP